MKLHLLPFLAAALVLMSPASAHAFSLGVGVEGGGGYTHLSNSGAMVGLGLILEQRFDVPSVELTIWEDVEAPFGLDSTWGYVPIDVGFRAGLSPRLFKPYVGILVNDNILISNQPACGCGKAASNVLGLGGDIGIDLTIAFLRFGFELRGYGTPSPPVSGIAAGSAVVLQGLLSARALF